MIHDEQPPEIGEVTFATEGPLRFHDLMHPIWRCHDRRLHASRAWEYRWKPELRRMTLCRIGLHNVNKIWRRDADEMNRGVGPWRFAWACIDCGHKPPLTRL